MSWIGKLHRKLVYDRRTRVLAQKLGELFPANATVLDVGCGDGLIDSLIKKMRTDLSISGVDVFIRPIRHIAIGVFNGRELPFADQSFDLVLFVDVLHHTDDPEVLLREAVRVARQGVILKDHFGDTALDRGVLRFMDWVGNAHHGVGLPYNYWSEQRWQDAYVSVGLKIDIMRSQLGLYPFPFSLLFDRKLHFLSRLRKIN